MRQLHPEPVEEVDLAAAYDDPTRRRVGRPWVMVNMISSVDGAAALGGRSGGLASAGDRAVFSHLRRLADVVLVGAETVRAEGYRAPTKPGQRIAVVTRAARLDWSGELFESGAGLVVLPDDGPDVPVEAVRAGEGDVDLRAALEALDADVVLCEGGPSLNGQLLSAGLVDELCLTIAPVLVAGSASRIVRGPEVAQDLELVHLLEEKGYLFARYHAVAS